MNNLIVKAKTIDLNALIQNNSSLSLGFQSKMIEKLNESFTNDEQNW